MLKIHLDKASKRFQYEWIFKNLSLQLKSGDALAVTGGNGSGKSTLLKCISGAIPITSGQIAFDYQDKVVPESDWYKHISLAAPYLELPEEFTLEELIHFHFQFKKPLRGILPNELINLLYLDQHASKPVAQFSSGMKQRLKLGLAFFSEVPLVLLDEPTSNLDKKGISWYNELVKTYQESRILVVCSNEPREYDFCTQKIALEDYK
jgi:ABC-type multidrug transport system ATPase subunit